MKILSIGNSFSEDAQRYLHKIAETNGKDLTCANLYIGGCSLRQHYINLTDNEKSYDFQFNGENTNVKISIKDAVKSNSWDYITLQQASHESFNFSSYTPYIERIAEWLRVRCPNSEIILHQTWAYPQNRERLSQVGFKTTEEMFGEVKAAYDKAKKLINADKMIQSGDAMLKAYKIAPDIVYRDAIHASLGFGRYLIGCVWYKALFDEIPSIHLNRFDESISDDNLKLIGNILK